MPLSSCNWHIRLRRGRNITSLWMISPSTCAVDTRQQIVDAHQLRFVFVTQRQVQHQIEAVVDAELGELAERGFLDGGGQGMRHCRFGY